jgi:hypothetical protein
VDAFSGSVDLYMIDTADPLVQAWADAFPTLFRSANELPTSVSKRFRYPADLFDTQATVYERFHATQPAVFASDADVWTRPTSLSGAIEVAGDIEFDEDDEDELRHRMLPAYKFTRPPGQTQPRLVLSTYYSPLRGQNLVGSLEGWVDEQGHAHLAARVIPRDPITLGPAQVSRLVFATPRVRNLLGLRNLELRDLDKSSIDRVSLGKPHLVFLPSGVLQIQSLYEGASGPGVSRILGVTAFLNGRAGLGPDIESAVRQAVGLSSRIEILRPTAPIFVGTPVELRFRVSNAEREVITITSSAGRTESNLSVRNGLGTFVWRPSAPGHARVRALVEGVDGSIDVDTISLRILSPSPTVRLINAPRRAVVGRRMRVRFEVTSARREIVSVSTRAGTFERLYLIRNGTGFIRWTPRTPGQAVIRITTHGRQGQTAKDKVKLIVVRRRQPGEVPSPVSAAIDRAESALERAEAWFALQRYGRGIDELETLSRAASEAHRAALAQIAEPPADPESDERPGPPSVLAVLDLDHRIGVRVPALFDGVTRERVIDALRRTLRVMYTSRDRMLDVVIALDPEGAGADYADGMADTLPAFAKEATTLENGLDTYDLTQFAREVLSSALMRVEATREKVTRAFGGGE